jgi:hypothetical protein
VLRRPRLLLSLVVAGLGVAGPVASAPAAVTKVTGAYVYFKKSEGQSARYEKGNAWLIFRTDRALSAKQGWVQVRATIGSGHGSMFTISREQHCYGARVTVDRGAQLGVGTRARVTIGQAGSLLSRRLTLAARKAGDARGKPLGCTADPKSLIATSGPPGLPEIEPSMVFSSANAGPYVEKLAWTGWGTPEATGSGTYVSDCASCGPKEILPAEIVLSVPRYFAGDGVTYYTRECLRKLRDGVWTGKDVATGAAC